jgi:hypothetical protein
LNKISIIININILSKLEVIIVVVEGSEDTITKQLNEFKLEIRIEFVSIPNSDNRDFGTADSLRYVYSKDKIKVLFKKR